MSLKSHYANTRIAVVTVVCILLGFLLGQYLGV